MKFAAAGAILVVSSFFAQQGSPTSDPYTALWQLGIGALIAVPFVVDGRFKAKRIADLESRIDTVQTTQLDRERALSDRMAPLLEQALGAARDTTTGVETVIERHRRPTEIDLALRRLEILTDEMTEERRRERERRDG